MHLLEYEDNQQIDSLFFHAFNLQQYWKKCKQFLSSVMQFNFSEINVRKKINELNKKSTHVTIKSDSFSKLADS